MTTSRHRTLTGNLLFTIRFIDGQQFVNIVNHFVPGKVEEAVIREVGNCDIVYYIMCFSGTFFDVFFGHSRYISNILGTTSSYGGSLPYW